MNIRPTLKSVLFFYLSGQLFFAGAVSGKVLPPDSTSTTSKEVDANELLYQIKFDRVKRLLRAQLKDSTSQSLNEEIVSTLKDAESFANQEEYDIACDFLDDILESLRTDLITRSNETSVASETKQSNTQLTFLSYFGSDLWQQKFGLSYSDQDSTIFESQGNPFVGLRILFERSPGTLSHTLAELDGKISNDYNSALFSLEHFQSLNKILQAHLQNRTEATSYKSYNNIRYLDNQLNLDALFRISTNTVVEIADEMHLRKYERENDFFNSFFENSIGSKLRINPFGLIGTELRYEHRKRHYPADELRDFQDNIVGLDIWPKFFGSVNFSGRVYGQSRHYSSGFIDSLFTNDFTEIYSEVNFRQSTSRNIIFRMDGTFEYKNYIHYSSATPNYIDFSLTPSLTFHIGVPLALRFGYIYRNRVYSDGASPDAAIEIENYFSHGPLVALDIIAANGFLLSLSNTLEFRQFPNAPDVGRYGPSLYADRTMNSFFLFLTWNLSNHWELTGMGNIDDDVTKASEGSNSRTNLVNIELVYRF